MFHLLLKNKQIFPCQADLMPRDNQFILLISYCEFIFCNLFLLLPDATIASGLGMQKVLQCVRNVLIFAYF
jgi:hypothetical protein